MAKKTIKKVIKKTDNKKEEPITQRKNESIYKKFETLYVIEGYTMREIADDYELNYQGLRNHAHYYNWSDKRKDAFEKLNKTVTEKIEERIETRSQELIQKNARRSKQFRLIQRACLEVMNQGMALDKKIPGKMVITLTPKDMRAISSAFMEAVRGEMLQDGQAIEIKTITKEDARNPVFEAILKQEDLLVEAEQQVENSKQETEKLRKQVQILKSRQNGNTQANTQTDKPKKSDVKGNDGNLQA